ncbi:protein dispatched homolog 1 isoform X3 [Hydra vulgaris]|uniref:Protein dispatched homolog 1 isoform X3 n=1 Tax=Hydra vulgaris TaxID=6087 RepID=A0ABM4CJZ8_HYDVU
MIKTEEFKETERLQDKIKNGNFKENSEHIESFDSQRPESNLKKKDLCNIISSTITRLGAVICAFYVNRPKLAFTVGLCIQLSLVFITAGLYIFNYDIFPYDFTQVPLNLEKDPTKLRADAFNFVVEDNRINLQPVTAISQGERNIKAAPLELVYRCKDFKKNVVTAKNLKSITELEKELFSNPMYQRVCHLMNLNNSMVCSPPMSLIHLFDGTYRSIDPVFYDPDFKNITFVLNLAKNISELRPLLAFSFDKHSVLDNNRVFSTHLRSLLFAGLPLHGYRHAEDRKNEQLLSLKKYIVEGFGKLLADKYKSGVGELNVFYMNLELFFNAVEKQVIWDLLLAGGSLVFIFCFIWFQTGSLWITGWAIFSIITNFFGANLIYRIILDFRYIGIFHVLSVFIILGIGADDIFVFYNTWKLMENEKFSCLQKHLTETFRIASGAMFVTSLTTAVAFFASATSPLLGVSSFGVFSGILVMVNFCSVCIFFPSVVVTYHYYWKDLHLCSKSNTQSVINGAIDSSTKDAPQDDMTKMFKNVVKWFETSYSVNFVLHNKLRWVVLLVFFVMSVIFLVFALKIGPDEEMVQVWPKGTNWYDMRQIKLKSFTEMGGGMDVIRIYIVWGLKNQDRKDCHFTDFKCKGKTVFDEDFDMNKNGCQAAILNFCRRLKNLSSHEAEKLAIRRDVATGELEVSCFIDEMNKYFQSEQIVSIKTNFKRINYSIPLSKHDVISLMETLPNIYNTSILSDDYHHYFEVALGYWLSNGGYPKTNFDYYKYASYMGGSLDTTSPSKNSTLSLVQGGRYGNRLRYIAVVVNTTISGSTLRYKQGNELYENWENYIETETKDMPVTCKNAFQCTPEWNNWHWLKVQQELMSSARKGIVIGLCLAFPVLILATFNWIIGVIATAVIGLITLGVVGLIPLVGWQLGVLESINLTLVVGLSVDYVVHLADGYVRSLHFKRDHRVRFMLGHVGMSVIAGAATTIGASSFMLGSQIKFFLQFGIFMFCTISFAIIYALVLFCVIVGVIGPEGSNGSLKNILCCLKKKTLDKNQPNEDIVLMNKL